MAKQDGDALSGMLGAGDGRRRRRERPATGSARASRGPSGPAMGGPSGPAMGGASGAAMAGAPGPNLSPLADSGGTGGAEDLLKQLYG
jgi:hypothetical protein